MAFLDPDFSRWDCILPPVESRLRVKSCRQFVAGVPTWKGFVDVLEFVLECGELPGKEFTGRIYYVVDKDECDPATASCSYRLPHCLRADAVHLMVNYRGDVQPFVDAEEG